MKQALGLTLFFLFSFSVSMAQEPASGNENFKFEDGIFLNFDQVKTNSPISGAEILSSIDFNDKDFYKTIISAEKIYYYNDLGERQEVEVKTIWGFSQNGVLYIRAKDRFNRLTIVGKIGLFIVETLSYNDYYNSPYYGYGYPYYNYYGYNSYYYRPHITEVYKDVEQYIIDFESGQILKFNLNNTKMLLKKDPELYEQFVREKKSRQEDLMFVYIYHYNKKHPLEIPHNSNTHGMQ